MKYGQAFGLIPEEVYQAMQDSYARTEQDKKALRTKFTSKGTVERFLKRPEESYKSLISNKLHSSNLNELEKQRVEIEVKYEGYIARQLAEAKRFKGLEHKRIPSGFSFLGIRGIRKESEEKLESVRPKSLGQASRIPGISPCDLSLLAVHVEKSLRESSCDVSRETNPSVSQPIQK